MQKKLHRHPKSPRKHAIRSRIIFLLYQNGLIADLNATWHRPLIRSSTPEFQTYVSISDVAEAVADQDSRRSPFALGRFWWHPLVTMKALICISLATAFAFVTYLNAGPSQSTKVLALSKAEIAKVKGKIQFVDSFPDYKVQIVDSFPDLKVKKVTSFPDDVGEWQIVDSFPDFKIQIVDSFPDFKVKYVTSFPGLP